MLLLTYSRGQSSMFHHILIVYLHVGFQIAKRIAGIQPVSSYAVALVNAPRTIQGSFSHIPVSVHTPPGTRKAV
jgi:hypothetical protein